MDDKKYKKYLNKADDGYSNRNSLRSKSSLGNLNKNISSKTNTNNDKSNNDNGISKNKTINKRNIRYPRYYYYYNRTGD